MASVEKTIDVNVPVETAYNLWTQFESFPSFMEGVESVQRIDDTRLHWRANLYENVQEWDAAITEQIPDDRVAWTSIDGPRNAGVVTFHRLAGDASRVALQLEYDPEGFVQGIGDALGFVSRRVQGDLERFKDFIESRGFETGAWRGEVQRPASASAGTSGRGFESLPTGVGSDYGSTDDSGSTVGAGDRYSAASGNDDGILGVGSAARGSSEGQQGSFADDTPRDR